MKTIFIPVILVLLCTAELIANQSAAIMPQLQLLKRTDSAHPDTTNDSIKITADSASIISPKVGEILTTNSIQVEIAPKCSIDSLMITVSHSDEKTDTLGVFKKPPYKAIWNCSSYPDQDQLHLKFGYILFHSNGKKIICPPLAHRWVLDRSNHRSKKTCHCSFVNSGDISIDGNFSDWKRFKKNRLGNAGFFKCLWNGTHILFFANVEDSSITEFDRIELHFDLYKNRDAFSGINHRTIIFNPLTRSNCLTVSLNDSGFKPVDSINVLLSREMEWRKEVRPDGYSIETSLPVFALSDIQYAPAEIGFDVSLVNIDRKYPGYRFTSWAGTQFTNRYNSGQWGTMALHQAMLPLRLAMFAGVTFFLLLLIAAAIVLFYQNRGLKSFEKLEEKGYSEQMKRIIEAIYTAVSNPFLDINALSEKLQTDTTTVENTIRNETGRNFPDYLEFIRIRYSKKLLHDVTLSIKEVAERCGFHDETSFVKCFETVCRVSPENFRKRVMEENCEQEEE